MLELLLLGVIALGGVAWLFYDAQQEWKERMDAALVDLEIEQCGLAATMRRRWKVL